LTIVLTSLLVPVLATYCSAQKVSPSLGLDFGYFIPVGDWNSHRYAEGVDLFKGGLSVAGEFEFRLFKIPLALFMSYTRFNLDDWIAYARENGDEISASASMYGYGLLFKFYFLKKARNFLEFNLGMGFFNFQGQESFAGYTYDYNFLTDEAGFIGGLGYKRLLSPRFALCIAVKCIAIIEGIRYADGQRYDIVGLPVTAGVRFIF
jgi:hypothetical protein